MHEMFSPSPSRKRFSLDGSYLLILTLAFGLTADFLSADQFGDGFFPEELLYHVDGGEWQPDLGS